MDQIARSFGDVLKRLRKNEGLSQEELALNCGLDRTFIGLLERGERQPSLTTVFLISEQLKMPASDLIRLVERARRRGLRRAKLPSSRL